MKYTFLSLLVLLAISAAAQEVSFGVKSGISLVNQRVDVQYEEDNFRPGRRLRAHAGVFLNTRQEGQTIAAQLELLYSGHSHGGLYEEFTHLSEIYETKSFHYLVLPILVQVCPTDKLSLHLGPQLGFLLGIEATNTVKPDHFKRKELAVAGGADYYFTPTLGVSLRHVWGMSDVEGTGGPDDDISNRRNRALQLSLLYKLKN